MSRPRARAMLFALSILFASAWSVAGAQTSAAAVCPEGLRTMEDVGLVCDRGSGMVEVFTPALVSLGYIHARADPAPTEEPLSMGVGALGGTSVHCVSGAADTYHVQVIYARASDDADGYATWLPEIRWMVGQANKLVDDAGIATGSPASLKVKCASGLVEVRSEVLPTPMASASFSTIVADLQAKGYNNTRVKYWVFYDDTGACSCGGQGNLYGDDTLAVTNKNNGNAQPMYAINYGYNSTRVMLHELGHNMGAVQDSAPRSTLAGHCYDGRDTMCYNDGGANGHRYNTSSCATEVWDCGRNDYFHANPPAGSYLAAKWNIGSSLNRYIQFGAPSITSLVCPSPVETDQTIVCTFVAADDSPGVSYLVNWGDGTTTTVPPSGTVPPGQTQNATKTYLSAGARSVSVTATDTTGLVSAPASITVSVVIDDPLMTMWTCRSPVELGSATSCSMRASDLSTGVRYSIAWGDASTSLVPSSGYVAPGTTQVASKTYPSNGTRTATVTPTDVYGHTGASASAAVTVVWDLTPPTATITDPRASTIYHGCSTSAPSPVSSPRGIWVNVACVRVSASDARSGVARVEVWLDGARQATDTTAPYVLEFPVPRIATNVPFDVRVYDQAGNVRNVAHSVDMLRL